MIVSSACSRRLFKRVSWSLTKLKTMPVDPRCAARAVSPRSTSVACGGIPDSPKEGKMPVMSPNTVATKRGALVLLFAVSLNSVAFAASARLPVGSGRESKVQPVVHTWADRKENDASKSVRMSVVGVVGKHVLTDTGKNRQGQAQITAPVGAGQNPIKIGPGRHQSSQ